jgi:hypothetical protein
LKSQSSHRLINDARRVYLEADEVARQCDTQGKLNTPGRLALMLGKHFGAWMRETPLWEIVLLAVRNYREVRSRTKKPLRHKTETSLKGIDIVGPLLPLLKEVGLRKKDVTQAQVRRQGFGFIVTALAPKECKATSVAPYHVSKALVGGWSVDNKHVTIDVATTGQMAANRMGRSEQRTARYRVPHVKFMEQPRFVLDLIDHFVKQGTIVMGLDLSVGSALSNTGKEVAKLLRRGFRARKAAGAVEARMVSTLGREAQDGAVAEQLRGADAKSVRMLKASGILTCPECGSMVDVKLNMKTGDPVGRTCYCEACKRRVDMGSALAYRARVWSMEDWRKSLLKPDYDAQRGAQISKRTSSSIGRKKQLAPLGGTNSVVKG